MIVEVPYSTEAWIARHLQKVDLLCGTTTASDRRELIRQEILDRDLGLAIAGQRHGKAETWADLFHRIYGEPLFHEAT